jgi:hypothetical protein
MGKGSCDFFAVNKTREKPENLFPFREKKYFFLWR